MSSLKIVGSFNKLSKEMMEAYPPLEPGKTAVFKLLGGVHDASTGETHFGGYKTLPGRDRIRDIGSGAIVEIGVPMETKGNEVLRCKKKVFNGGGAGGLVTSKFTLSGNSIEDQEFYQFFIMSNYNASNPNRDQSIEPLFEVIDLGKELQARSSKRSKLLEALKKAENMHDGEAQMLVAAMNQNPNQDMAIIRDIVSTYAQNNPEEFLSRYGDPLMQKLAAVKQAEAAGVIKFDPLKFGYIWGQSGEFIAQLDNDGEKTPIQAFVDWMNTKATGEIVYSDIVKAFEKHSNDVSYGNEAVQAKTPHTAINKLAGAKNAKAKLGKTDDEQL